MRCVEIWYLELLTSQLRMGSFTEQRYRNDHGCNGERIHVVDNKGEAAGQQGKLYGALRVEISPYDPNLQYLCSWVDTMSILNVC